MHKLGIFLVIAAVVLRALTWYQASPYYFHVIVLMAIYTLLFFSESSLERNLGKHQVMVDEWIRAAYLILQMSLIVGILIIPPLNDFGSMLFIPISLQAVLFFRRNGGYIWISVFTLVMATVLVRSGDNFPGGLAMAFLFGGICFLAGSYSNLIHTAEQAMKENQRTLNKLHSAHQELQKYALQREELTIERERGRLAREMHDSVTQTVFSMNLSVQSARLLLERDTHLLDQQFERLQLLASKALDEIKMLVAHLQSAPIAKEDLLGALDKLFADRRSLDSLNLELECTGEQKLPKVVNLALYLIIQEALTNVVKHSKTQKAVVRLNLAEEPFFVEIEDHGIGFDPASTMRLPGHLGVAGMESRASEVGWRLSIDSQPGRGTLIRVEGKSGVG